MLNIQITAKNLELTLALKDDVNKKLAKLEKHFNRITIIHVTLSIDKVDRKFQHVAKAHIALPNTTITAESTSEDMYTSIDLLSNKLDRQVKEYKERLKDE